MESYFLEVVTYEVAAAAAAGGEVAPPPLEIPGLGTFAIHIHDGVRPGLWKR